MTKNKVSFYPKVKSNIKALLEVPIVENRLNVLNELITYVQNSNNPEIQLIYICTQNSRRSQFAQVCAQTAAA
jgi:arsenate reductase